MRRLKKMFAGFLLGMVVGALIGALGGTLDRGSMFILVPSGPPFWAIVGAFFGGIAGTLYGAFSKLSSREVPFSKSEGLSEGGEKPHSKGGADYETKILNPKYDGTGEPTESPKTRRSALFDRDDSGRTRLFYAAEKGLEKEVQEMIFSLGGTGLGPERLALISIQDHSGLTAADLAEQNGHDQIAELLRGEQFRMEYFE